MDKNFQKQFGVFGSAFDPVHYGHLDVLRQVDGRYQTILIVPSFRHPFGKKMAPFATRIAMVKALLAEAGFFKSEVCVLDMEQKLAVEKDGPIYTYDVLTYIAKEYGSDDLEFIIGPDNADRSKWHRYFRWHDIEAKWGFFVVEENLAVRSSVIRTQYQKEQSMNENHTARAVYEIMQVNHLYTKAYSPC